MRFRRKRPASSVEPERYDAAAEVLERWATRGSRQSALYSYKREARQRRRAAAPPNDASVPGGPESLLIETPEVQPLDNPAHFSEPVPSEAPPPGGPEEDVESPAAAIDRLEREQILASQLLAYGGPQERERVLDEEWHRRSMSWEFI